MAGQIPKNFIDLLLSRVDIVDVINPRVPLKKAGAEYKACCPFHNEKTPSFTVSPTKQFYHCFGCGAHGTAVGFLMEYERLGFVEAIEELAAGVGMDVPREQGVAQPVQDHSNLYQLLSEATDFFAAQLRRHPDAPKAVDYLKSRGLSGRVAAEFKLGFAPPGWSNLLDHFGRARLRQLDEAGLLAEKDGRHYDRFRERIIYPIHDERGRVIGLGGRAMGDAQPKYLNSPESALFHKGSELYGLYQARRLLKDDQPLLVVEGYMDVLALVQFEIREVVATLGTATTADHLKKLYRRTTELVFCFDGDRAGRQAAEKALDVALPFLRDGRGARFLFLPEGHDPDSLVRVEGTEAFRARMAEALPASELILKQLRERNAGHGLEVRARLGEQGQAYLDKLPEGRLKMLLADRIAQLAGTDRLSVRSQVAPARGRYEQRFQPRPSRQAMHTLSPVRRALILLLNEPSLGATVDLPNGWEQLQQPGIDLLVDVLAVVRADPGISPAALIERWDDPERRRLFGRLAAFELEVGDDKPEQLRGALGALVRQAERGVLDSLPDRVSPSTLSEEEKARIRALTRRKVDIEE